MATEKAAVPWKNPITFLVIYNFLKLAIRK
jgi:hypothetical protein